jgi:hypothetical protein
VFGKDQAQKMGAKRAPIERLQKCRLVSAVSSVRDLLAAADALGAWSAAQLEDA